MTFDTKQGLIVKKHTSNIKKANVHALCFYKSVIVNNLMSKLATENRTDLS